MVIGVNTRLLISGRLEGIGWFTYESLKRITTRHPEHQFVFFFDRRFSDEFIFAENVKGVIVPPPTRHPVLWYLWFEKMIPGILKKYKTDLFFSPDGFLSLSTSVRSAVVIHDINFVHRPGDLPFIYRQYFNHYFPVYARKACRIATVSEYSKKDISVSYGIDPGKIDVVYNGANIEYIPLTSEEKSAVRKEFSDGKEYFIFIGALHPRKNVENLLFAFDEYKKASLSSTKMVIVGEKMFRSGSVSRVMESISCPDEVIFAGRLNPKKLKDILGTALALTFVPYFEGFGIPALEAMYCDVPVVTSGITSLPEVCGNAAIFADPYSIDSIKEAMLKVAGDASLRKQLIENGRIQRQKFNWDNTASKLWTFIEKASVS